MWLSLLLSLTTASASGDGLGGLTVGAPFPSAPEWKVSDGRYIRAANVAGLDGKVQVQLCGTNVHNIWFSTDTDGAVDKLASVLRDLGWLLTESPSVFPGQATLRASKGDFRRELTGTRAGAGAELRTLNTAKCTSGL